MPLTDPYATYRLTPLTPQKPLDQANTADPYAAYRITPPLAPQETPSAAVSPPQATAQVPAQQAPMPEPPREEAPPAKPTAADRFYQQQMNRQLNGPDPFGSLNAIQDRVKPLAATEKLVDSIPKRQPNMEDVQELKKYYDAFGEGRMADAERGDFKFATMQGREVTPLVGEGVYSDEDIKKAPLWWKERLLQREPTKEELAKHGLQSYGSTGLQPNGKTFNRSHNRLPSAENPTGEGEIPGDFTDAELKERAADLEEKVREEEQSKDLSRFFETGESAVPSYERPYVARSLDMKMEAENPLYLKAKEALFNTEAGHSDRYAKALEIIQSIPKDQRPEFLYQARKAREIEEYSGRAMLPERMAQGVYGGLSRIANSWRELVGQAGTEEEIITMRSLVGLHSPTLAKDPWWDRALTGAASGAPEMALSIGAGKATGTGAKKLGFGKFGQRAATTAGIMLAMQAQGQQDSYYQMRESGVSPEKAVLISPFVGAINGAIESIIPNPAGGVASGLSRKIQNDVARAGVELLSSYAGEMTEEALQNLTSELINVAATRADEYAPDLNYGHAIKTALKQTADSAATVGVLVGAGGAAHIGMSKATERSDKLESMKELRKNINKIRSGDFDIDPDYMTPEMERYLAAQHVKRLGRRREKAEEEVSPQEETLYDRDGNPIEGRKVTPADELEAAKREIEKPNRGEWLKRNKPKLERQMYEDAAASLEQQERELWSNPSTVVQWVNMDPKAAGVLAAKGTYREADFEEAGLPAIPNPEVRGQWKQWTRELLALPEEVRSALQGPTLESKLAGEWQKLPEGTQPPSSPSVETLATPFGTVVRLRNSSTRNQTESQESQPDAVQQEPETTQEPVTETPQEQETILETPQTAQDATAPTSEPQAKVVTETAPETTETIPEANPEKSEFQVRVESAFASVPTLSKATIETDDVVKTATVTLPDGSKTTVHFDADDMMDAAQKRFRKTAVFGMYVRREAKSKDATPGDIYLRSGTTYETLNHEVVHWLQDIGIVTDSEMAPFAGDAKSAQQIRERFARAYEKWVKTKDAQPQDIFTRVMDFMKRMLGDTDAKQRKLFSTLPDKIPGTKPSKKTQTEKPHVVNEQRTEPVRPDEFTPEGKGVAEVSRPEPNAPERSGSVPQRGPEAGTVSEPGTQGTTETVKTEEPKPRVRKVTEDELAAVYLEAIELAEKRASENLNRDAGDTPEVNAVTTAILKAQEEWESDPSKGDDFAKYASGAVNNALNSAYRKQNTQKAKKKKGFGEGGDASVVARDDGTSRAKEADAASEAASNLSEHMSGSKRAKGYEAFYANTVEGVSYAEQARRILEKENPGVTPNPKAVSNLSRNLSYHADAALRYMQEKLPEETAAAVKHWENEKAKTKEAEAEQDAEKRKLENQGRWGAPRTKVPVSATAPDGRRIAPSKGEVVKGISKAFGFPIRFGHFRAGKAIAGIYKQKEGVSRLHGYGDIAAATHESAHDLIKKNNPLTGLSDVMRGELAALDYDPERRDIHEGFAEYVRHLLTEDDAAGVAPVFHDWFTNTWLPRNSKEAASFNQARDLVDSWRDAGPLARAHAQIAKPVSQWKKIANGMKLATVKHWIVKHWYNKNIDFWASAKEMTGSRNLVELMEKMDIDKNFAAVAKVLESTAAARARSFAHYGMSDVRGVQTGASLKDTLSPIADELNDPTTLYDFYSYTIARHTLDITALPESQDVADSSIFTGMSTEDAEAIVAKFSLRPGWEQASDGLTDWHNGLIDYLVDAGGLTKKEADTMKSTYPHYISLLRDIDSKFVTSGSGGGGGYVNKKSVLHRRKGSQRQIIPPLESAMAMAERIIGFADRIRVGRMIVEAAEEYDVAAEFVEKVDPATVGHDIKIKTLEAELKKAGANLEQTNMDAILTVFSNEFTGDPKNNIVTLYRNGKQECYWIRDDLYETLTGFNSTKALKGFWDVVFGKPARLARLAITGIKPGFALLGNPPRDIQIAAEQTTYQKGNVVSTAIGAAKGIVADLIDTEEAVLWKRGGGEMANFLAHDRRFQKAAVDELLAQSPKAKFLNWSKHPVESIRTLLSVTESGPRIAEFSAAIKALGWKPGQELTFEQYVLGQLAAANVTTDFREGGDIALFWNKFTPFFNANLQGQNRLASALRNYPVRSIIRGIKNITLVSLFQWWWNKDEEWYKQLTPMEHAAYWHARLPGTETVIRIPKPFEWGHIFGTIPEAAVRAWYEEDPQAVTEAFEVTLRSFAPDMIPQAAKPPAEMYMGESFYTGRPLITQGLERLNPQDQYNPYTSETAKRISALFAREDGTGSISPIYLEHLVSGYTGGMATDIIKAVESATGMSTKKTKAQLTGGLSQTPVFGRLFLSKTHTRVFDDFYNTMDRLEQMSGSAKLRGKEAEPLLGYFKYQERKMSELRKETKEILDNTSMSDDSKRDRFIAKHNAMLKLAKEANQKYKQAQKRKK